MYAVAYHSVFNSLKDANGLLEIGIGARVLGSSLFKLLCWKILEASRPQTFFKLKLPNALPFIFAGLKTAAVLAVVGAIVGEFLGGGAGFGELIRIAGSQLAIARVFAFVTILSVIGYLLYSMVVWVERRVVFWRSAAIVPGAGM
jgi:NitT/TauT family transport system permease protein